MHTLPSKELLGHDAQHMLPLQMNPDQAAHRRATCMQIGSPLLQAALLGAQQGHSQNRQRRYTMENSCSCRCSLGCLWMLTKLLTAGMVFSSREGATADWDTDPNRSQAPVRQHLLLLADIPCRCSSSRRFQTVRATCDGHIGQQRADGQDGRTAGCVRQQLPGDQQPQHAAPHAPLQRKHSPAVNTSEGGDPMHDPRRA